jgi:hypothetical protein
MNKKSEMPGNDDNLKRHPARGPSDLVGERKLKFKTSDRDAIRAKAGRPVAPRDTTVGRGDGKRAA